METTIQDAAEAGLDALDLRHDSIDDHACALMGFQRTKQISRRARRQWEAGNPRPMRREVRERRDEIIRGTFVEVWREYLLTRAALGSHPIESVCDIGCGQGINDVFLWKDYAPRFTLVDIETSDTQYHAWAESGAGYASLAAARALLVENGCPDDRIETINPLKAEWTGEGRRFDLVTSLYSCGFHYPVDAYVHLFLATIEAGGAVCLDLRKRYAESGEEPIKRLLSAGEVRIAFEDTKTRRVVIDRRRSRSGP